MTTDARVYTGGTRSPSTRYWDAIPDDERERIVAAVPDGHRLHVWPGYKAKPGTANAQLRTAANESAGLVVRGYLDARLCWMALRAAEAVAA